MLSHTFGIINAFICINNPVNSCINSMLSPLPFFASNYCVVLVNAEGSNAISSQVETKDQNCGSSVIC